MPEEIVERLKQGKLLESDVPALVEALSRGEVVASGAGAVAAHGDIINSHLTTFVFQGTKIDIPEPILAKLNEAVRRSLPPVLHTLPPVAPAFTGRVREEEEIVAALVGQGGSAAISALKGIGGVGKTALAVKIGHRLTVQFPDAQLLVDLCGTSDAPAAPRVAMESVIRRFLPEGQLPDDDAAVLEIYRDLLGRKKVFLILDNAKDTAQVGRLLPPAPSAAIVTSRQVLLLVDARSVRLDDLPLSDAMTLVLKLLDGERSPSEEELRGLAQDCCLCHPLSLRVAALFLKGHKGRSVSDYIAGVAKDRARLKLQGLPDHDVLAVIGQSLKQLRAEDEALCANWRDLSAFPSDFDAAAAAAVWGSLGNNAEATSLLRRLFRRLFSTERERVIKDPSDRLVSLETRGLIEPIADDRYRLHDLLRDVARRDWPEQSAAAAARRYAEYFVSILGRADTLCRQGGAAIAEGLSLFDRERTNIEAGQRWAAAAGAARSEAAARLSVAYANAGVCVLSLRLDPREWIRWGGAALVGCRRIGDRQGEGTALGSLGLAYAELGETRKAIEHYEQVLTIAREIGDLRGEGNALGCLGNAYTALGATRRAIEHYEPVLTIAREIGDRHGEGKTLGHLGLAYGELGETRNAIEHYERSLIIAREIGDRRGEGNVHANLGVALQGSDPGAARAHWQAALAIYTAIEDPIAARVAQWLAELDRGSAS
jgi:tetratricopeptide (TPR) repeat protein